VNIGYCVLSCNGVATNGYRSEKHEDFTNIDAIFVNGRGGGLEIGKTKCGKA